MNNLFTIFTFIILCLSTNNMLAQQKPKVKSATYGLLLKKLIPKNVPFIAIDSLQKISENVVLLDAREQSEYEVSHLKNAQYIGYNTFDITTLTLDKNTPIVVYCSVGYRSAKITEKLISNGFTDVKNLYGGIFEWKNDGNAVYNKDGETNNVHPYNASWGIWLKKGKKVYKN